MGFKDIDIGKILKTQKVAQDLGRTTAAIKAKQKGEISKYELLTSDDTPTLTQFYKYRYKQTPQGVQMIATAKEQSKLQKQTHKLERNQL